MFTVLAKRVASLAHDECGKYNDNKIERTATCNKGGSFVAGYMGEGYSIQQAIRGGYARKGCLFWTCSRRNGSKISCFSMLESSKLTTN